MSAQGDTKTKGGRPKKNASERAEPIHAALKPQAREALKRLKSKYDRPDSDFVNAAIIYLERHALIGLDGNLLPNDIESHREQILKIAMEGIAKIPKVKPKTSQR